MDKPSLKMMCVGENLLISSCKNETKSYNRADNIPV
jgi:hypothetical protein